MTIIKSNNIYLNNTFLGEKIIKIEIIDNFKSVLFKYVNKLYNEYT